MNLQSDRSKAGVIATMALCSLLTACATGNSSMPVSTRPVVGVSVGQAQQDESLPVRAEDTDDQNDRQVDSQVDAQAVRWGGTIARIENQPENVTLLEVVSRPLHSNGRPVRNDLTSGRFIALVPRFLDPAIVKVGRDITVAGLLVARQSGKIGQTDYIFPVLQAESYHYWKRQIAQPAPRHFPHWNTHPGIYRDSYRDPWILHKPTRQAPRRLR